ncbi:MAG: T9SS type A sorting domain-containing protein, partial [Bacteroidales bacterium]
LNESGDIEWQRCYGGVSSQRLENPYTILKKSDYNYVIAASTEGSPTYDVQCGTFESNNAWIFEIALPDTVGVITATASANEIKVYPNPATTELWLQLPENTPLAQAQIALYNSSGRLLYKAKPSSHFHKIDVAHLPKGLYLVRLWDGERWYVKKLVVR